MRVALISVHDGSAISPMHVTHLLDVAVNFASCGIEIAYDVSRGLESDLLHAQAAGTPFVIRVRNSYGIALAHPALVAAIQDAIDGGTAGLYAAGRGLRQVGSDPIDESGLLWRAKLEIDPGELSWAMWPVGRSDPSNVVGLQIEE